MRRLQLNQNLNKKKRFRKTESSNHSKAAAKDSYVVSEEELSKAAQSIGEIQNEQTINDMMIHMSLQNSHSMGIIFMFPVPVM